MQIHFKMISIFIIIFILVEPTFMKLSSKKCVSSFCRIEPYYEHLNRTIIICKDFGTFYRLSDFPFECEPFINQYDCEIKTHGLVLNKQLNLLKFFNNIYNFGLTNNSLQRSLQFDDLAGIDINLFSYSNEHVSKPDLAIKYTFLNIQFQFYYNNEPINECGDIFMQQNASIFQIIDNLVLEGDVRFNQKICLFIFKNSLIYFWHIEDLIDSFVKRNILEFEQKDYNDELNSTVYQVEFEGYNYKIDNSLLERQVFRKLEILSFYGQTGKIQEDLFKSFNFIKSLKLHLDNFSYFVHYVGFEWTAFLNYHLNEIDNFNSISDQVLRNKHISIYVILDEDIQDVTSDNPYTFPDHDLCLFKNFPHQKLVYPVFWFLSMTNVRCSCTIYWLLQHTPIYKNVSFLELTVLPITSKEIYSECQKNRTFIEYCINMTSDLEKKCHIKQTSSYDKTTTSALYDLYTSKYLVSIISTPAACVLGFLLNYLIIRTIRRNKNDLKEGLFIFMSMNAYFNCAYCLIYLCNLMSECIIVDSVYCSSVRANIYVQYIKIVLINFIGNAIKICSNVTYLLITINRYMLVGKNPIILLQSIAELSLRKIKFALLIFCIVLSLPKLYVYDVNLGYSSYDYPMLMHEDAFDEYLDDQKNQYFFGNFIPYLLFIHDFTTFYSFFRM